MVTRASKASNTAATEGDSSRPPKNESLSTMHKDAIVMATAMASAAAEEAQARSPPNAAPAQNHLRDTTPVQAEEETAVEAYLPPSPMVTPPLRGKSNAKVKALPKGSNPDGVPHIYHDYSQVPEVVGYVRKKTGGVTNPFPEKLHEMLQAVSNDAIVSQIVTWCPHGRAFIVRKPKQFTEEIMPKYFKQTKLTSFQRQLNLYGFRRITQGTDAGAYYHELFLRGRPSLCQRMVRQKVKGTGHKQPADAKTEPNFYAMPSLEGSDQPAAPTHYFGGAEGGFLQQQQQQTEQREGSPMMAPMFSSRATMEQQRSSPPMISSAAAGYSSSNVEQEPGPARMGSSPSYESRAAAPVDNPNWQYAQYSPRSRYPQPPPGSVLDSPASPGLHGAAHLLQGIASGYSASLQMPDAPPLLGPTGSSGDDRDKGDDDPSASSQHQGTPVSFLQPRMSSSPSSYKQYQQHEV